MSNLTISDLHSTEFALNFVAETYDLTDNESGEIIGGGLWSKIKEGVRDYYSGVADGLNGQPRQQSNFNYLPGYIGGSILNKAVEAIPG